MRGYYTIATFVIALLALTSASAAAPQPKWKNKGVAIPLTKRNSSTFLHPDNTVNFAAVEAHSASVSAKIVRGLDNYEKNTGTTHPSVLEQRGPRKRDGDLALRNYGGLIWHARLSIGSPPKVFDVGIDTGFADFFVAAARGKAIVHHVWDPSSSNTAIDLNRQFKIEFADGNAASGKQYTDTVTLAGITADKQTIGAATTFKFMESHISALDGMLGLAFQSISDFPARPLFKTLVRENKVKDPVFSFQLSSSGGQLFIGGTNEALYQKDTLIYADVTKRGYWQIKMDELQGNGETIANAVDVVIDTGSNFIYGQRLQVWELHYALGGEAIKTRPGFYSLPCKADPEPSVILTFGGRPFKIPIDILRLGPVENGSKDCFSMIAAEPSPSTSFWIIGAPFLQSVYTVFDYGTSSPQPTPRVGFAELA